MALVFIVTALSPLVQPAVADPVGADGKPPPGGIGGGAGGESASSFGNPFLPASQLLVNGTQVGGDCGAAWSYLNGSDDLRCSYQEADKSPADQIGLIVLPNATANNGWAVSTPCSGDADPHNELDDLPPGTDDGDGTCRQGSGGFIGVGLEDPVLTDPANVDDFTVVTSSVVKKVASQGASIAIDVKVGTSAYNQGSTQSTTTSYVRYSRTDAVNPITGVEWTFSDILELTGAVRCVDCSPNNRATQLQAKVDAVYNAEHALEVRYAWANIPVQADGWYLVAECQRNTTGMEVVEVQVGQGGNPPTAWKTAFLCSSTSDETFDPYPLSAIEVNDGAPIVRIWDANADSPDDGAQGILALDVLRMDVAPWADGLARVAYQQPLNISRDYANNTVEPALNQSPGLYAYETSYGNYTFPANSPYLFSMFDLDGRESANASTFVVEGTPATTISGAYVLFANNTTFRAIYNVTSGATFQGTMEIDTTFSASARPKMTAIFSRDPAATITNWRIRWKVVTEDHYLQGAGDVTTDFGAFGTPTLVGSSPPDPTDAVVGPSAFPASWNSSLLANWSDVGTGSLYVGPVSVDASHSGQGIMVDFPLGMATIDPSMVARSGTSWATRYTNQKKVFYHGGSYFAFFRSIDQSVPVIQYASGRESGENATGMVWDSPVVVVRGEFKWSFDVDHRNGVVAVIWVDGSDSLKVKLGNVFGSTILWRAEAVVIGYTEGPKYPPSVAIGTDGFVWAGVSGLSPDGPWLRVWRSILPEDNPSFLSTTMVITYTTALRLVPLGGGDVMLIRTPYASTEISWKTWIAADGVWTVETTTQGLNLKPNAEKVDAWTAVGDLDAQGSLVARLLYVDNSVPLRLKRHTLYAYSCPPLGGCPNPVQIDSGLVSYPAIQIDVNGDLHHFWAKEAAGCSNCRRVYYQWVNRTGTTSPVLQPFVTSHQGTNAIHLSTGFGAQVNRAFLVYTDTAAPGIQVFFASLPTRRAVGGAGGAPWERPGISAHSVYSQQLSEFVAPGSGLLYIKEVDLSAPGRGLDLAVERLYRAPDAFTSTSPPGGPESPWGHQTVPYYSLGRGWSLNLPALSSEYVYLWDGQRFPIAWSGNVFENRDGEYFRVVREPGGIFMLYTRSGISYTFLFDRLDQISDTNVNQLNFVYTGGSLDKISDNLGRDADFDYVITPDCPGASVTPARVCKVTYGGRTVEYRYTGDQLTSVIDPLGRTTTYAYCSSACSVTTNGWLIKQVRYATGAQSEYEYASVKVGTDASAYVATKQLLRDAGGQVVRKKTFDYDIVNGAVANVKITHYDGPGAVRRSEMYVADAVKGSFTAYQFDAAGTKRNGQRIWFGLGGRIAQSDVFMGTVAAENMNPTYSTYAGYDGYGNLLYSRSAMGAETLSSYVNSDYHGAFYAPGRLEVVPPLPGQSAGKVWVDDFRDYTFSDWTLSPGGGKSLDSLSFGSLPPSLKLETTPTLGQAWAKHTFTPQTQSAGFVANVLVKPGTASGTRHDIRLLAGTPQITVWFDSDGTFRYTGGSSPWPSYSGGTWYLVTVEVLPAPSAGSYKLYLNGKQIAGTLQYTGPGAFDGIDFVAGVVGSTTTLWVNEVAVFTGRTLKFEDVQGGLLGGTRVRVLSAVTGKQLGIGNVGVMSGTASITLPPYSFPRVIVQVLNSEWGTVYASPSREFWGGSTLKFIEPRLLSDVSKTSSGFLQMSWLWVDESMPSGTETNDPSDPWPKGEGGWWWSAPNSATAASGSKYHESPPKPGRHGHGFRDGGLTELPGAGDYWIQYAYVQPDAFPAEILRAFQHSSTGAYYRAFWGGGGDPDGLDGLGGQPYTGRRQPMGPIPAVTDRWIMLIVKQRDLQDDPNGAANYWKGTSYYVVAGGARWDLTALKYGQAGSIRVFGVPTGGSVDLYDAQGNWKVSASESGGFADLAVYDLADWSAFPARGYFIVRSASIATYRSPVFEMFGGDDFQYSTPYFYPNDATSSTIKDRLAGVYRVQERDAGGNPSVVQRSYFKYDSGGRLLEAKAVGPSGPVVVASRTYDLFGNVLTATSLYDDSNTHTTTYEYSPLSPFFSGFLTKVSDGVSGNPVQTLFDFESGGEMKSVTAPAGGTTSYVYDAVGRPLTVTHPDATAATLEYFDAARLVVAKGENYNAQTAKRQAWQCYDSIGRLLRTYRFDDTGSASAPSCSSGDFTTEILRPNDPGSPTQWSPVNCAANWQCVSETSSDGDATYVTEATQGESDQYAIQDPVVVVATIVSVTVRATARAVTSCNQDTGRGCAGIRLLVNGYAGGLQLVDNSYVRVSHTWGTNPGTGLAWTLTEVKAIQAGAMKALDSTVRLTQLEVVVSGWASPYYSRESYTYDWEDRVDSYTAPRGPSESGRTSTRSYDFLGRLTRVTNPDTITWVDIAYDDATNTRTVTVNTPGVQNARMTEYVSDWDGHLMTVREWIGSTPYSTAYTYDDTGNVKTATTPVDATGIQQTTSHEYESTCQTPPCSALGRLTKTTYPDGTNEQYSYFNSGLLKQKILRDGKKTTYAYDELRRLERVCWDDTDTLCTPGEADWDYDYDANGNLARLTFRQPGEANPVTIDYTYVLARGWVDTEKTTVDGVWRMVDYDYDNVGNVVRIRVLDASSTLYDVQYAYDAFDRACAVAATAPGGCTPGAYYARLSHYADDALDTITYAPATGVTTKYTYGTNGWPSAIETKKGSTTHLRMDYEDYDTLGNPERIKHTGSSFSTTYECFTYDALNRLAASNTATASGCAYAIGAWSWNLAYQYDPLGNRLQATDGVTTTYYRYASYSRLCATRTSVQPTGCTDASANRYTHNGRGEVTQRILSTQTWAFTYGLEGKLTAASGPSFTASYLNDGLGRRVKSVVGGTTNVYVYSGLSVIYETNPATKYVFAAGLRLAKIGASTEYYHYDHLGNVRIVTSGTNGNVVSKLAYKPFGLSVVVSGSEPKYGYTGEYRESTPNLIYLHSRWYDPTIGRFLSPDDRLGRLSMPQDHNRYAYVVNNPLAYTDPTGHAFWFAFLVILALLAMGTVVAVAAHYVPALRPVADAFAFAFGFVPVYGDAYAAGYFLVGDALDCMNGRCDGTTIALDVMGVVPVIGDFGKISKGAKLADLLPHFARAGFHADEAVDVGKGVERAVARTDVSEDAARLAANQAQGAAGETRGATWLRSLGETVAENPKGLWTPFGTRYHDARVVNPLTGKFLYYVEFKTGGSPYKMMQRVKDMYLQMTQGIPTLVIRFQ